MKPVAGVPPASPRKNDEHRSWLHFVDACQVAIGRSHLGDGGDPRTSLPSLVDAANRLHTHADRLLGSVIVFQIASRLGSKQAPASARALLGSPSLSEVRPELLHSLTSIEGRRPDQTANPRVLSVLRYIEAQHLSPDCRLATVALELRTSRTHLSRLMVRETGVTFRHHLQVARMRSAATLLTHTDMSIKEVASATGYEHVPSFNRKFGRHFHLTPSQFRRLGPTAPGDTKRFSGPRD